ncbi:MAG: thiamine diphosphokinase [Anaerolineales bacterium]
MRAVIFAAGDVPSPEAARRILRPDDWILAADGGARHCRALGIRPAVVIGDLDSLSPEDAATWRGDGTEILAHPPRKDQTDLELAVHHAIRGGATAIVILGVFGGRWDHTLANWMLSAYPSLPPIPLTFTDGQQRAWRIHGETEVEGEPGDRVSLIPIGGDALGVSTSGLEYPLDDETLRMGASLGVSNTLLERRARVSVREGCVLLFVVPTQVGETG